MRWGLTVAVVAVVTLLASAIIWSFRLQTDAERAQSQRQQGVQDRAALLRGGRQAYADPEPPRAPSQRPGADTTSAALSPLARFQGASPGQQVSVLWDICQDNGIEARVKLAVLRDALQQDSSSVRSFAVSMLGNMGPEAATAVPSLAVALGRRDLAPEVCAALGKMGAAARPALPALEDIAQKESGVLQEAARDAIRQINAPR